MEEVERDAPYDDNERDPLLPDESPEIPYYGQPRVSGTINSIYDDENLTVHSNPHSQTPRRRTSKYSQAFL